MDRLWAIPPLYSPIAQPKCSRTGLYSDSPTGSMTCAPSQRMNALAHERTDFGDGAGLLERSIVDA